MKITGRHGKIPLWAKLAFTAFMAVLVPIYWIATLPGTSSTSATSPS